MFSNTEGSCRKKGQWLVQLVDGLMKKTEISSSDTRKGEAWIFSRSDGPKGSLDDSLCGWLWAC